MNREVLSYKQRLDNLFVRVDGFYGDEELQAHLARYLCIIVCGFLENSLRAIYGEYAQNKSHRNVANFVDNQLNRFMNPNMERILNLAGKFSQAWRIELENLTKEKIKESVDSLVANRNQIAHGADVGITIRSMKRQYDDIVKLVMTIEKQCNN